MEKFPARVLALTLLILVAVLAYQYQERTRLLTWASQLSRQLDTAHQGLSEQQHQLSQQETRLRELEQTLTALDDRESREDNRALLNRALIGLEPVTGPGVLVLLSDSPNAPEDGEDPWPFSVHDVDVAACVNELWAAGAEAISINGHRMTMRSPIRCVGPAILVNHETVGAPFEIRAIGPAKAMESGLTMRGGFLDSLEPLVAAGGNVRLERRSELVVPAFRGPAPRFRHARPFQKKEVGTRAAKAPL